MENKKQIIKITESDLYKIIKESVKNILNESSYDELERANKILDNITKSSFIPFSSPAPSSTEQEIKNAIIEAMRLIDKARYLCSKLGYNNPIAHIV
jgi:hypothetical protein